MMKPHLIKLHGVWHCSVTGDMMTTGIGYTPLKAYDDWLSRHYNAESRRLKKEAA